VRTEIANTPVAAGAVLDANKLPQFSASPHVTEQFSSVDVFKHHIHVAIVLRIIRTDKNNVTYVCSQLAGFASQALTCFCQCRSRFLAALKQPKLL